MGVGLALRARGAKVIFDVHEDIPQDIIENKPYIPAPLRRPIAWASELVLRTMQRGYSAIVTATPTLARRFPHRRTVVVCNYPRIEELPQDGLSFSQRPRTVVYLGSITRERGMDELVAAMDSPVVAPDVRLVLAGTFDPPQELQRIQALPGFRKVEYTGFCPRAQVASVLGRARAGLAIFRPAANHDEAIPTKLFEYLGSGLPVIISKTQRFSALVREHDCGIVVDALDVTAIAHAIMFLIDNPDVAQAMGERGRRLVTERYQWTSEANKLTTLYAEIA
jgi:glycosyltransferase involved in cell wall biosynthesis